MTDKDIEKTKDQQVNPAIIDEMSDPAAKSLTNALTVSFAILKIIMIILVLIFIASGFFTVESDEQAIVLRFGKIRGEPVGPGYHFGFPSPIDQVIKIPVTKTQTLTIDSLWYKESDSEKLGGKSQYVTPTLKPDVDGYCLTRNDGTTGQVGMDYNIVHSKWVLTYKVDYPEKFFRNMYYKEPKPGEQLKDVIAESVNPVLRSMVSNAVVTTMVKYSIDDAVVSERSISRGAEQLLQEKLTTIQSGITVVSLVASRISWPRQVNDAFEASNKASQTKQQVISEADGYRRQLLSQTGGPQASEILTELKKDDLDPAVKQDLLSKLAGQSQEIISKAKEYRTNVVTTSSADATYLKRLLPEYRKRPELVKQKIYQDAIEEVLDNADEKILIQPGNKEIRIQINRDPTIGKKKLEGKK
ncbi:MAG: protease modulator HflK [Anaerohalosphaera sp.]|nr:protease modulator HflK [Anaerohalosphaera sp.]